MREEIDHWLDRVVLTPVARMADLEARLLEILELIRNEKSKAFKPPQLVK